jgi:hypothetical protein
MARPRGSRQPGGMRAELPTSADPAVQLYDTACDLLLAAQGLRQAAGRTGTEEALAATLGCLHETLAELAEATTTMARDLAGPAATDLAAALAAAGLACGAARAAAAGPRRDDADRPARAGRLG